jgi:hypothetical protein
LFKACASSKFGPEPERSRIATAVFSAFSASAKPSGVAVEIAELRQQDSGDLVVRAEALLGDRDGLFGQRDCFGLLPGQVEPADRT